MRPASALVLSLVLLSSAAIANAGLVAAPPVPLSAPALVPPPGLQSRPEFASSGRGALALWIDDQSGRDGIYAARLTPDGERVAGSQQRIHPSAEVQGLALCWSGRSYVATWYEPRLATAFAAALDEEGNVVTAPHAIVANAGTLPRAIASNGREVLVAYVESSAPAMLRGAILDAASNLLRSRLVLGAFDGAVALASDGEAFYVFTATTRALTVARLEARGTSAQSPPAILAAGNFAAAIGIQFDGPALVAAFDGVRFAVAAIEEPRTLRRLLVDPATLAPTELPAFTTGAPTGLALATTGSAFAIAWTSYDAAHERYLVVANLFDGRGLDRTLPRDAGGPAADVATVWGGRRLLFAWTARSVNRDFGGFGADVVAAASRTVPESVGDPFPLALAPQWQEAPAIAASETESIAVWREPAADGTAARFFARRVVDGVPAGSTLALTPRDVDPSALPRVVFTGAAYLVYWSEFDLLPGGFHVYARRLSRAGELLDDEPLLLANGAGPSAASNGAITLLAFGGAELTAIRFDAEGRALPEPPRILGGPAGATATASNGRDFFVAFEQGSDSPRLPAPNLLDIMAIHVDAAGFVLDPAPIAIAATPGDEHDPAAASDGRDYLEVGWSSGTFAQTIVAGSTVLTERGATPVALTFAGHHPFAAWYERTASPLLSLHLARTNAPTATITLGQAADVPGARPSLAPLANGAVELASPELVEDSMRILLRLVAEIPPRSRAVPH